MENRNEWAGISGTLIGYVQRVETRTAASGRFIVRMTVKVPAKDHPQKAVYWDVPDLDGKHGLQGVPERAKVRVTGRAAWGGYTGKDGQAKATQTWWPDRVEVLTDENRAPRYDEPIQF